MTPFTREQRAELSAAVAESRVDAAMESARLADEAAALRLAREIEFARLAEIASVERTEEELLTAGHLDATFELLGQMAERAVAAADRAGLVNDRELTIALQKAHHWIQVAGERAARLRYRTPPKTCNTDRGPRRRPGSQHVEGLRGG